MAATARVIRLCACVRCWPYRGVVLCDPCSLDWMFKFVRVTCLSKATKIEKSIACSSLSIFYSLGKKATTNYNVPLNVNMPRK